jgi:hypothetical protein
MISCIIKSRQLKEEQLKQKQLLVKKNKIYNRNFKKLFKNAYKSCAICLQSHFKYDMCTILNCKHSFGSECLHMWINKNKNTCPICIQPFNQLFICKSKNLNNLLSYDIEIITDQHIINYPETPIISSVPIITDTYIPITPSAPTIPYNKSYNKLIKKTNKHNKIIYQPK